MNQSVKDVQEMIRAAGDRITADGIMGPQTMAAIDMLLLPKWVKIGLKEVGTKEISGEKHNPRVIFYHSFTSGYSTDEVPWCGSFVAMCMKVAGITPPTISERALSWISFGKSSDGPKVGSVAVKSRKGGGHVGIVIAEEGDYIYLLGGNQGNEVNVRKYKTSDFIDFRYPREYTIYNQRQYAFYTKIGKTTEA